MCGQWKHFRLALLLCLLSAFSVPAQNPQKVIGQVITLADGYTFQVDEVWKQGDELWYRKGNINRQVTQPVKSVKPVYETPKTEPVDTTKTAASVSTPAAKPAPSAIWIYLVDGARFRVDEVQEGNGGAVYTRNKISMFLDKERI